MRISSSQMKSVLLVLVTAMLAGCATPGTSRRGGRWWKGVTHLHSRWSDGVSYPEVVADWYKEHDYNFVVVTDHNTVQAGEKWLDARKTKAALDEYRSVCGAEWVKVEGDDASGRVLCRPLDDYRGRYEEPGEFLLIRGEELTCKSSGRQIHVVALNVDEYVKPVTCKDPVETFETNIANVSARAEKCGQPMASILCHPNWGNGPTVEEIWQSKEVRHFEVINGHPHSEWNRGNASRPSTERLWDVALTKRIESGIDTPLYGVAADDMHKLQDVAGYAWIMVRSPVLEPNSIVSAINEGDFYSSTGVMLADVRISKGRISVEVEPDDGVTYTIRFVGSREGAKDAGIVLSEVEGHEATYRPAGDELYVRVKVTSSEMIGPKGKQVAKAAWSQPMVLE